MYILMAKDKEVCKIDRDSGKVEILRKDLVPLDLYLETGSDADLVNNLQVFNWWCSHRVVGADREYAKEMLEACGLDGDSTDIALELRCVSLKDFYWIKEECSKETWADVSLFRRQYRGSTVSLLGYKKTADIVADVMTDGILPKTWVSCEDGLFLYKADRNNSVEKEVRSSQILNEIGIPVVKYKAGKLFNEKVSICSCFTNEYVGYVTAGDFNMNWTLERSTGYYFMNLIDFLVGNSDRHQDNWGYLFDQDIEIIGMAPIFDFDHAFEESVYGICKPEILFYRHISCLEAAKEALEKLGVTLYEIAETDKYATFVNERIRILQGRE